MIIGCVLYGIVALLTMWIISIQIRKNYDTRLEIFVVGLYSFLFGLFWFPIFVVYLICKGFERIFNNNDLE